MTDLTYEEAVQLFELTNGSGEFERFEQAWANWGREATTEDIVEALKAQGWKDIGSAKVKVAENTAGNINGYVGEFYGNYPSVVDSNVSIKGSFKAPINTTAEVIEERSVLTAKVGLREAGNFVVNKVAPAVVAAGLGITLGKTIDSALYNLAPDFWDERGMSSLDPTTWDSITTEEDGIAGKLFDLVFGIDSDGNTQTYLDEDAVSYLAWWLSTTGALAEAPEATYDGEYAEDSRIANWEQPLPIYPGNTVFTIASADGRYYRQVYYENADYVIVAHNTQTDSYAFRAFGTRGGITSYARQSPTGNYTSSTSTAKYTTLDSETEYYLNSWATYSNSSVIVPYETAIWTGTQSQMNFQGAATIIFDGTIALPVDGIGNQTDATLPSTTGWNDPSSTKQSLQQQYPTLWDNAKHQDYVDEEGQNRNKTLIPINLPNVTNPYDTQPTSGNRSQDEPLIDPNTATRDLIDTITKLISGAPPINPPTTGGGDSPTTVVPVGRASSLWKIYNPTQAQVDSFGSWLWSSDFVDQIKKLFNDPMQGIIGIHKVFASPSIGGSATIKVGYLDSQVASDWVDNQYTTVNCGSVKLSEYFGNVFDYAPYTKVSLYLPFIGIVDLDVADVMRSTISVKYHVDVLSGACLADVKVTRDLADAVLYQYSGSAIVTYPVSSGTYLGALAGVAAVATGAIAGVMTGGVASSALAVAGTATGLSHLHANVSHSGGFSGCAGAMAGKKPYLIVSRPITAMADNYGHFTGKPANSHVILNDCSGMTKVKSVYVGAMSSATDEEKDMIEAQLKAGVLI